MLINWLTGANEAGNTNTRKTQENFIIGTWEALNLVVLGKGQSWDGICVLGHYNLGNREKKNKPALTKEMISRRE